jgi:hypothetical protein
MFIASLTHRGGIMKKQRRKHPPEFKPQRAMDMTRKQYLVV